MDTKLKAKLTNFLVVFDDYLKASRTERDIARRMAEVALDEGTTPSEREMALTTMADVLGLLDHRDDRDTCDSLG